MVEDLPAGQIPSEHREFTRNPANQFFRCFDHGGIEQLPVVDHAEAGLALQWDDPEPKTLADKVVGGQPDREMPGHVAVFPNKDFIQ